jgi:hypothetical protein
VDRLTAVAAANGQTENETDAVDKDEEVVGPSTSQVEQEPFADPTEQTFAAVIRNGDDSSDAEFRSDEDDNENDNEDDAKDNNKKRKRG